MKMTNAELKSLYQGGTARSVKGGGECLSSEVVMRAATEQLSEGERGKVADHLAGCSDCAREFQLVYALKPWAEESGQALATSLEPGSHSESTATWLPLRPVEQSLTPRPVLWQRIAAFFPLRPPFALPAHLFLLLTLLALGFWIVMTRHENSTRMARLHEQMADREQALDSARKELDEAHRELAETNRSGTTAKQYEQEIARLHQTIAELSSPQLDIPIIDIDPGGSIRRVSVEPGTLIETPRTLIETPKTAKLITLILNFAGRQQYSGFEVEIFDQSGKQVWRGRIARRSLAKSLNLTISRRLLPGGRYQIKLFGLRDGKMETITDYPVTLRYK
ncbi:MAG: hypothetical protein L0220_08030 [Acidobacteria bacterium]|nr:hypothetical protein [Acidobacteriota bacterium]